MSIVRLLLIGLLLSCTAFPALAQSGDDGSIYSRYGIGQLRSFHSSRAQSMGGGGTALWSLNYANFANPAALSRQFLVRASGGVRFDNINASNASDDNKELLVGSFSGIQFGLPIYSNRLGMGFAFQPYSRVNYRVSHQGELDVDPTRDPTPFAVVNQGNGGLQQLRLGLGFRLIDNISVGVSVDYLFGIVEDSRRTTFDSVTLIPTNVATSTRMRGFATTFGTIAGIKVGEEKELSVAAVLRQPFSLTATRTVTLGESLDLDTLGTALSGDINIPSSFQAGVAFESNSRWAATFDVRYEPWTNFESDIALVGHAPGALYDRTRISGGVELLPAGRSVQEPYLERLAYRLGAYTDVSYLSPVEGERITIQAITAGLSIPTLFGGTRLDLNLHVGRRGSASGILILERFVLVSATLNIGERWFLKRRLG